MLYDAPKNLTQTLFGTYLHRLCKLHPSIKTSFPTQLRMTPYKSTPGLPLASTHSGSVTHNRTFPFPSHFCVIMGAHTEQLKGKVTFTLPHVVTCPNCTQNSFSSERQNQLPFGQHPSPLPTISDCDAKGPRRCRRTNEIERAHCAATAAGDRIRQDFDFTFHNCRRRRLPSSG